MAYTGYRLIRSKRPRREAYGAHLPILGARGLPVVAAYLAGYHRTHFDENMSVMSVRLGPVQVIKASLKYLSMSQGPAARRPSWPYAAATVVTLILAFLAFVTAPILRREPGRRDTAIDLLPPDPRFREVRLPLTPSATHNVEWDGKAGRATGIRPFLAFDLDKPEFVCGLRIKYSSTNPEGLNPYFQVFTHKPGSPPSSRD